jgi:hypothetical protein
MQWKGRTMTRAEWTPGPPTVAVTTLALLACLPLQAAAQSGMSRPEATQLYTEAGFPIVNDQPVNRCRQPARARVSFVDLNADRRPEALFIDEDAQCYPPSGRYFAVLTKDGNRWRMVLSGTGQVQALPGRTEGWLDMRVSDGGCTREFRHAGSAYAPAGGCGEAVAAAPAAAATPPPAPAALTPADAATELSAADEAAAFKAAGFARRGKVWRSDCDDPGTGSYSPGRIEQTADLNGDSLPDVVISEGGTYCYGNTGGGFWLVAKQADGRWALLTRGSGLPQFLKTQGAQGWPDISVGGPGFCFPVQRWNGREYKLQRWEYDGKACKPPR